MRMWMCWDLSLGWGQASTHVRHHGFEVYDENAKHNEWCGWYVRTAENYADDFVDSEEPL